MRGIGLRIGAGRCRKWGRLADGLSTTLFGIDGLGDFGFLRPKQRSKPLRPVQSGHHEEGGRCEPYSQVGWEGSGGSGARVACQTQDATVVAPGGASTRSVIPSRRSLNWNEALSARQTVLREVLHARPNRAACRVKHRHRPRHALCNPGDHGVAFVRHSPTARRRAHLCRAGRGSPRRDVDTDPGGRSGPHRRGVGGDRGPRGAFAP